MSLTVHQHDMRDLMSHARLGATCKSAAYLCLIESRRLHTTCCQEYYYAAEVHDVQTLLQNLWK